MKFTLKNTHFCRNSDVEICENRIIPVVREKYTRCRMLGHGLGSDISNFGFPRNFRQFSGFFRHLNVFLNDFHWFLKFLLIFLYTLIYFLQFPVTFSFKILIFLPENGRDHSGPSRRVRKRQKVLRCSAVLPHESHAEFSAEKRESSGHSAGQARVGLLFQRFVHRKCLKKRKKAEINKNW